MTQVDAGPIVSPASRETIRPTSLENVAPLKNSAYDKAARRGQTVAVNESYGFWDKAMDAAQTEWAPIWGYRMAFNRGMGFDADPEWMPTREEYDFLTKDIPQEYIDQFEHAVSRSHAYAMRFQIMDLLERRGRLAGAGLEGAAFQLGAAIFDPGAVGIGLVAGLATGGTGAGAVAAGKATRIGTVLKAAAAGGASEAFIEGVIAADDPERGVRDVLLAGTLGAALGGGFARMGLGGKQIARAEREMLDAAERSQILAMGAAAPNDPAFMEAWRRSLTDNQTRRIMGFEDLKQGQNVSAEDARKAWGEFYSRLDLERLDLAKKAMADAGRAINPEYSEWLEGLSPEDVRKVFDERNKGFQQPVQETGDNDVTDVLRERAERPAGEPAPEGEVDIPIEDQYGRNVKPGDLIDQDVTDAQPSWSNARVGTAGRVGSSDSPIMRMFTNYVVEDVLPKSDGTIQQTALLSQIGRAKRATQSQANRALGEGYREYRKALGLNAIQGARPASVRSFNEAVTEAIENGVHLRSADGLSPHMVAVRGAAAKIAKIYGDELGFMQRHRVPGMDDLETNPTYVNLEWSPAQVRRAYDTNREALENAYATAIRAANPDWSDDAIEKVARAIPKRIIDGNSYMDPRVIAGMRADNNVALDNLREMMIEEGVDEGTADFIVDSMRLSDTETGNRAKRRTWMDLNTRIEGTDLSLSDLREKDIDKLTRSYIAYSKHAAGTQRLLEDMSKAMGLEFDARMTSLQTLRGQIAKELQDQGKSKRAIDRAMADFDTLAAAVRGRGLEPNTRPADIARLMRSINFSLFGGTFGLAQIPELANIPAMTGWGLMLKSIPELNRVARAIRNGENVGIELGETLEAHGVGLADRLLHGHRETTDEIVNRTLEGGGGLQKAQNISSRINNGIAHATGLIFVDEQSRRLAAVALSQKAWNYARRFGSTGKLPSKGWMARVGLDEDRARRMFGAMGRMEAEGAITRRDGSLGIGKFTDFNVRKMYEVDATAAGDFLNMVQRGADNIIYRADLGQLHPSQVRNPAIKIALQFRSFATAAWERGVLQNVYHHDMVAAQTMLYTWMTASLVYMLRENVAAAASEDPDEHRRERLNARTVALAGFRRAGPASFLPDLVDSGLGAIGMDPLFDHRNTGLSSSPFQNWNIVQYNPTTATAGRVGRLMTDLTSLWRDDQAFTQGDFRNATKLIPGHNVEGLRQVLEKLGATLPEEEPDG